ncbi:DUF7544 domain-containing protein [Granulicella mallensis]|uniref:Glycerophosphoryl diester phosphodiesterase membrane domain-containing protein n=1 Tax=Granulicella mallensis (strain ATCC BAA-1857 / DSM 23137 / MP5ACTX8) TaxID=682795 RepID=G8NPE1_GRAMM|nr:hypothetical protein [Granulicella mallensis]AEU34861.1 hypothetical protein AciX8_0510 [Granulicella mallensis MP5ACTX8]
MRPLSAVDAIAPAWNHTRRLLIAPRSWRLLLKISAVAFFANVGGGSFSSPYPGRDHLPGLSPAISASLFAVLLVIGGIASLIALALFYLGSRLQFVLFEIVLRRDTTVAPIWRRYGRATWYWMGLKLAFFAIALLCIAPLLIPIILHLIHAFGSGASMEPQNFAGFFLAIFGFGLAIFAVLIVIGAGYTLLHDFGLPFMALEGTSLTETVRRVVSLVRAEPGQMFLYLVMRVLLAFAGALIFEMALFFGLLIALIPLGGLGVVLWAVLHHAGTGGHVLMIAGWVVLGIILFVLLVGAVIMALGYLHTFLQAYALYFLGGRYPLVGQYLEPLLPPPMYAYPGVPPGDYSGHYPPAQPAEAPPSPAQEPDSNPEPDSNT